MPRFCAVDHVPLLLSESGVIVILACSIPQAPNITLPLVMDELVIVGANVVDVIPDTPPVRYAGEPPTSDEISVSVITFAAGLVVVQLM